MSSSRPTPFVDELSLDPNSLTRSAINAVRVAFGVAGVVAVILGIVLLVWPEKSLAAIAIIIGINFIVVGIVRLSLAIFVSGLSGGLRVLSVLFGVLLIVLGVVAIKNSVAAGTILAIVVVVVIGVGWILEGVIALVESGRATSRGWAIAFGIVSVLAGIVLLVAPELSAIVFVTLSGILLAAIGVAGIARAITFGRGVITQA